MASLARSISIALNAFFLLAGIVMVAIGAWARAGFESFADAVGAIPAHLVSNLDVALMVVGSVIVLFTFVGLYGAAKQNRCFLALFMALILLMVIGEAIALIFIFVFTDQFQASVSVTAKRTIAEDYGMDTAGGVSATEGWNFAQKTFACCGFDGGSDYAESAYAKTHTFVNPWPATCCATESDGSLVDEAICRSQPDPLTMFYHDTGCAERVTEIVITHAPIIGGIGGAVIILQIITFVLAGVIFHEAKYNRVSSSRASLR